MYKSELGRRILLAAVACGALGGTVSPAWGTARVGDGPSTLTAGFTTEVSRAPTGLSLQIDYRRPGQPDAAPPAVTHLDIALPRGTTFNGSAVPSCGASDAELLLLGRLACPASTQIGDGSICVDVAAGPILAPACTDTVWFNGGDQLIEVVEAPGPGVPALARERLSVTDGHLTADVQQFPGGPPNQTDVTTVTAEIYQRGDYFVTPPQCPPDHVWTLTATFGFNDGTTQSARASTPCR